MSIFVHHMSIWAKSVVYLIYRLWILISIVSSQRYKDFPKLKVKTATISYMEQSNSFYVKKNRGELKEKMEISATFDQNPKCFKTKLKDLLREACVSLTWGCFCQTLVRLLHILPASPTARPPEKQKWKFKFQNKISALEITKFKRSALTALCWKAQNRY